MWCVFPFGILEQSVVPDGRLDQVRGQCGLGKWAADVVRDGTGAFRTTRPCGT
ncbi:hypothetical protein RHOER0001_4382 [Rhodococcus erythropolis SK121]|nr:hypothetical protein RHOER0001_4382 [Rhodococcus erythropolis SK121]